MSPSLAGAAVPFWEVDLLRPSHAPLVERPYRVAGAGPLYGSATMRAEVPPTLPGAPFGGLR
jgi:hypothetical protein